MKKILALVLAMVMAFALCACGETAAPAATPTPIVIYVTPEPEAVAEQPAEQAAAAVAPADPSAADKQVELLYNAISSAGADYYAVTDLDGNGRLELFAVKADNTGKLLEVNSSFSGIDTIDAGNLPDVVQTAADTFRDASSDTCYYIFQDVEKAGATAQVSFSLKNGAVTSKVLAKEVLENGGLVVIYQDANGKDITPDEYNQAGLNAYSGFEKSAKNFGWFNKDQIVSAVTLSDSYEVFCGKKAADPVAPAATPAPEQQEVVVQEVNPRMYITKNPTSEYPYEGDTAIFMAKAENWHYASWTFISPYGATFTSNEVANMFPYMYLSGQNDGTLYMRNVPMDFYGWGAYCTFQNPNTNQVLSTSTAYVYPSVRPTPTQSPVDPGYVRGTIGVMESMNSVPVIINGATYWTTRDFISPQGGDLSAGHGCTVYYSGSYNNITLVVLD